MTREEILEQLESMVDTYEILLGNGVNSDVLEIDDIEAIKEAIKALEQEPKILNALDFAIDASNGDTNYFVGFRNGLRFAKSLIDGEEPQFEHCTEQEPKTGYWIDNGICYECSECGIIRAKGTTGKYNYCPNCGCRMVEPQESKGEE